MSQLQRIGIFGGSFNPVHLGHLVMAQDAVEVFDLTKVMFVPCAKPPHKKTAEPIEARHRIAMLRAATEDSLSFEVSDAEIRRGGVSYAIDTVSHLKKNNIQAEFCFIIGSDTLLELHTWKDIHSLLDLCTFVTVTRPGFHIDSIRPEDLKLEDPWPERLLQNIAQGHYVDISSSDIRYRIAEGMNIRYLVPDPVAIYIAEHNLYSI